MGEGSVDWEECEVVGVLGLLGRPQGVVGGVATFFTNQEGLTLRSLGAGVTGRLARGQENCWVGRMSVFDPQDW